MDLSSRVPKFSDIFPAISPERAQRYTQAFSRACCSTGIARTCEWARRNRGVMIIRLNLTASARDPVPDPWTEQSLELALGVVARHYRIIPFDEAVECVRGERVAPPSAAVLAIYLGARSEIDVLRLFTRLQVPCFISVVPGPLAQGTLPWPLLIRRAVGSLGMDTVDMYGRRWGIGTPAKRVQAAMEIAGRFYSLPEPDRPARAADLVAGWGIDPASLAGLVWFDVERFVHSPLFTVGVAGLTGDSLVRQPLERAIYELRESRALMEDRLGTEVRYIDYPWGDATRVIEDQAARAGYSAGLGSRTTPSGMNRPGEDPFALISRPLGVGTPEWIRAELAGIMPLVRPVGRFFLDGQS